MDRLYAPNGRRIVATKDWVPAHAPIGSVRREADGTLDIQPNGEIRLCWEDHHTEEVRGERAFLDDEGNEWLEGQLALGTEPLRSATVPPATVADDG